MTEVQTPRRPSHRSDRYKESEHSPTVAEMDGQRVPAAAQPVRYRRRSNDAAAPSVEEIAPPAVAREERRRPVTPAAYHLMQEDGREQVPPPTMERPVKASVREKERAGKRMPTWLVAALAVLFFLSAGLFTAQSLMQAYLTQRQQEREAAYQRVVDAHPIYYKDLIEQYAAENNLHPAFVEAIILNESSYRTDAESSVGARGLMQIMPDTAEWIAGKLKESSYSFDNMYDAETNIKYGTWYLGYLSKLFRGDPILVSAAYHAGQGEVTGWLSDPSMSEDGVTIKLENMIDGPTKRYAGRVTKAYGVYEALYYYAADDAADDDTVSGTVDTARR